MQVLITILIILASLAIIAFIPIRFKAYVSYENKEFVSRYKIKYGFITIKKTSDKADVKHEKKPKADKDKGEKKKTSVGNIVRFVKTNSEQIKRLVSDVCTYAAKRFMRIERLRLNAVLGTDDAMQTAVAYGASSAVLYNGLGVIDKKVKIDSISIDYKPNFTNAQIFIDFECIIKTRIHSIFRLAAIFLRRALPLYRKRGDLANGKSD